MPDVTAGLDRDEQEQEVEITPEMIDAGAHALLGYNLDSFKPCEVRRAVTASFVAMIESRFQAPS